MTARPWRAAAHYPLPGGGRLPVGRIVTAATEAGLAGFRERAEQAGQAVEVWEVLPLPLTGEDAGVSALDGA